MRRLLLLPILLALFAIALFDTPRVHAAPTADMGVYDRGWRQHAQGTTSGNHYYVVRGDTIFSISQRFGVSQHELMRQNGIYNPHRLLAGSTLIIPGLGPPPTPGPDPMICSLITITSPGANTRVGSSFTVSGRASGRCNFTVRALDSAGRILAESGVNVNSGAGNETSWAVTLNVGTVSNSAGTISAVAGNVTYASVPVTYETGTVTCVSRDMSILTPYNNERLSSTFTVSGRAGANCPVTATARDNSGRTLAALNTTADRSGNWSVTMTVSVTYETPGRVEASSSIGGFDSRTVVFAGTSPGRTFIEINNPAENATLPATFTVSGRGAGLFEGRVIIRAVSDAGATLLSQEVTMQGTNVYGGGEGTFSLQMMINTTTWGFIEATDFEGRVRDSVRVRFNDNSGPASWHDFPPNSCQVSPRVGAPSYAFPDGPAATPFSTGGTFPALRGVRTTSGEIWFLVDFPPGAQHPDSWVRTSDLNNLSGNCGW